MKSTPTQLLITIGLIISLPMGIAYMTLYYVNSTDLEHIQAQNKELKKERDKALKNWALDHSVQEKAVNIAMFYNGYVSDYLDKTRHKEMGQYIGYISQVNKDLQEIFGKQAHEPIKCEMGPCPGELDPRRDQ